MGNVAALSRGEPQGASSATGHSRTDNGFDPTLLQSDGFVSRFTSYLFRHPLAVFKFLRRWWPIPNLFGWAAITRFDDVAEAMQNDKAVATPFGPKMKDLAAGPNFVLGMADSDEYQAMHHEIMRVYPPEDNDAIIAPFSYQEAHRLVNEGEGKIDGIGGLLTLIPILICEKYYGLRVEDKAGFARWTIAMSSYMFGDPANDPKIKEAAFAAAALVRPIVDEAIDRAQAGPTEDTIIARFVQRQKEAPEAMPDNVLRAIMLGMITGFVPTNTMASGHVLELLLSNPDWMRQARAAAIADDDDLLAGCLFEAMRFWPINPGPFRVAGEDFVIAEGTRREKLITKGTNMIVSTQSAMHDPRRVEDPGTFNPHREQTNSMLLGFGLHWCIGAPLARAQITQTFKALLKRDNVRRAPGKEGKMTKLGPFPENLWVLYD
ncbi:cytochrome P450 [uncultured Erythrobacter sp.]|uniref:cytochrome P450 n=1 Tax=uncultured Erythrobacter sp. TaxID=263913 RepID=UPI0026062FBE|nr:cytochrome P450 [uncultured Erythrobacter sp.]